MTIGVEGVGFLIPFENARYFFLFRGLKVSPIGLEKFLSEWGVRLILREIQYITIPCGTLLLMPFF
jgi:inner membrane protein